MAYHIKQSRSSNRPDFWVYEQEGIEYPSHHLKHGEPIGDPFSFVFADGTRVIAELKRKKYRIWGYRQTLARYETDEQADYAVRKCLETERTRSADWYAFPSQSEIVQLMQQDD